MDGVIKSQYKSLEKDRQFYLDRAEKAAFYTIPYLYPPSGFNSSSDIRTPYSSVGAEGVNNLTSKMFLSIFPPNTPFFMLSPTTKIQKETSDILTQTEDDEERLAIIRDLSNIHNSLAQVEMDLKKSIEQDGDRPSLYNAIRHGIVGGNYLIDLIEDGSARGFTLYNYVCSRDSKGRPQTVIVREIMNINELDKDIRTKIEKQRSLENEAKDEPTIMSKIGSIFSTQGSNSQPTNSHEVEVYTKQQLFFKGTEPWLRITQEVEGFEYDKANEVVPYRGMRFIPIRFLAIEGESYGRGYCDQYLGDLKALDGLARGALEMVAAAARYLVGVLSSAPRGIVDKILSAENGEPIVLHTANDIFSINTSDKINDLTITSNMIDRIENRLQRIFLMLQSIQRDAERVTKFELQEMINQLDEVLGGTYSLFVSDFQKAYINRKIFIKQRSNEFPSLRFGKDINIEIITGIEALGRNQELTKLRMKLELMANVLQTVPPDLLNMDILEKQVDSALHFTNKGIFKSQEQQAEMQQQAMQQQMVNQLAPEALKQGGKLMDTTLKQQEIQPNG